MTHMQRPGKQRSRWYGGGRRGWPLVKYGLIFFGVGVVITIATYAFAASRGGGVYLVSYGPMAVGLISMVRGGIDMARERRAAGPAAGRGPAGQAGGAMPGGMRPGAMSMAGAAPGRGAGMNWGGGAAGEPAYDPRYDARGEAYGSREPAFDPWQGNGARQETAPGEGNGAWQASDPRQGNASWQGSGPRQGSGAWQGADPRQGNAPWQASPNDPRQAGPGHAPQPSPADVPPPNWYPDPRNPALRRWWDGQAWTEHTRPVS